MEKGIKIGTVAKMVGVSSEALRFYARTGIVKPRHVGENGYRYYTRADITHLFKARFLQSMGFPLTMVLKENSKGMRNEAWISYLDERRQVLKQEIDKAERVLKVIDTYRQQVAEIQDLVGVYKTVTAPGGFFLTFSDETGEIVNITPDTIEEIKKWVNLFPVTRYAFICSKNSLLNNDENGTIRGFIIPSQEVGQFDIRESETVKYLPSRQCVYTVIGCDRTPEKAMSLKKWWILFIHRDWRLTAPPSECGLSLRKRIREQIISKYGFR